MGAEAGDLPLCTREVDLGRKKKKVTEELEVGEIRISGAERA